MLSRLLIGISQKNESVKQLSVVYLSFIRECDHELCWFHHSYLLVITSSTRAALYAAGLTLLSTFN